MPDLADFLGDVFRRDIPPDDFINVLLKSRDSDITPENMLALSSVASHALYYLD